MPGDGIGVIPESDVELGAGVDEQLVFQGCRADGLAARQRVLAGQCQHHRLAMDVEPFQPGRIFVRTAGKAGVEVLAHDRLDLVHRHELAHVDLDRRIGALKIGKRFLQDAGADRCRHEADVDAADFAKLRLLRDDLGFLDLAQHMLRAFEKP